MKRTIKKSISVLLTFTLLFGSFAFGFADVDWAEFIIKANASDTPTSGTCGDNLTWTLDTETGELVISGTGDMKNYIGSYVSNDRPSWYYSSSLIKTVTICDGVTSIGNTAFWLCRNITSVTIPDSVTVIGWAAFRECESLLSITIPKSVEIMGWQLFSECTSLTSITVEPENPSYSSDEYGVLFNKDKTELIHYPAGNTRTSYVIPDSVTRIYNAFEECDSLTSVIIPDSVTIIGDSAFEGCENLKSLIIPDSVTNIGEYAFAYCDSLASISIPNGVTSIECCTFVSCNSLTSVKIPDSVTSIGNHAFNECTGLTSVTIGDNVTNIGDFAFYHCTSLTSVTIPDSVISIGYCAFCSCDNLTSVTIPESITHIGGYSFADCEECLYPGTPEQWNNNVTISGNNDYLMKSLVFECNSERPYHAGVMCGENLFYKLYTDGEFIINGTGDMAGYSDYTEFPWYDYRLKIKSVTIGNGVESIADEAFYFCCSLTSVAIPDSVTRVDDNAFNSCFNLKSVTIPDSVTSIGDSAFRGCYTMEYIHIPSSVTSIEGSVVESDSEKAEFIEELKSIMEEASEEELAELAVMYCITKESVASWKPTTVICSDSEDSLAKTFAEKNGNKFVVCNGNHGVGVPQEPTTQPTITEPSTKPVEESTTKPIETTVPSTTKPATTKPVMTEPITTKPVVVPSTTQPVTTEPLATKPAEIPSTTKPVVEPTTKPVEVPSTTKPIEEPTIAPTIKPVETTKPTTTEPTTKPIETTKPVVEPATKPTVTEPSTTKPVSTTKPEPIEEEIIKKPSTSTVKYGETLILHADFANIPEGAKIEWSVDGNGVTIAPSADGKTCAVTSTATGDVTITAKYTDSNGVEHVSEQEIKSNASFWQKIVSFFKNLFGISRIIEQVIKF